MENFTFPWFKKKNVVVVVVRMPRFQFMNLSAVQDFPVGFHIR